FAFTRKLISVHFQISSASFDSPFASATLLFVPVVLSAIALYREGSRIASKAFAYARAGMFLQFAAVMGATLPFALRLSRSQSELTWYIAASIAWAGCLRVTACTVLHFARVGKTHQRWRHFRQMWESANTKKLWRRAIERRVEAVLSTQRTEAQALLRLDNFEAQAQTAENEIVQAMEQHRRSSILDLVDTA